MKEDLYLGGSGREGLVLPASQSLGASLDALNPSSGYLSCGRQRAIEEELFTHVSIPLSPWLPRLL